MFTPALFTVARPWRQPKGPSTEERIKKTWYIYTMDSAIEKNKTMPFATTFTDTETVILSKVSQTEGDKYCIVSLIHKI